MVILIINIIISIIIVQTQMQKCIKWNGLLIAPIHPDNRKQAEKKHGDAVLITARLPHWRNVLHNQICKNKFIFCPDK